MDLRATVGDKLLAVLFCEHHQVITGNQHAYWLEDICKEVEQMITKVFGCLSVKLAKLEKNREQSMVYFCLSPTDSWCIIAAPVTMEASQKGDEKTVARPDLLIIPTNKEKYLDLGRLGQLSLKI